MIVWLVANNSNSKYQNESWLIWWWFSLRSFKQRSRNENIYTLYSLKVKRFWCNTISPIIFLLQKKHFSLFLVVPLLCNLPFVFCVFRTTTTTTATWIALDDEGEEYFLFRSLCIHKKISLLSTKYFLDQEQYWSFAKTCSICEANKEILVLDLHQEKTLKLLSFPQDNAIKMIQNN